MLTLTDHWHPVWPRRVKQTDWRLAGWNYTVACYNAAIADERST